MTLKILLKTAILIPSCFVFSSILLHSQKYNTALGIRSGKDFGITVQQRITRKSTIEGVIQRYPNPKDLGFQLLLERHKSILTRRINLYGGAGIHSLIVNKEVKFNPGGLSFIIGAEITLGRINLSWDFLPFMHVWNTNDSSLHSSAGFSLRYVLIKEPKKKFFRKYRR